MVLLLITILIGLLGITADAGQGPSQWCSDNGNSSEIHLLNDPVTFNLEPGTSSGNPNYFMVCYSTTPYGNGSTEATGGSVSLNAPTQNGTSMGCWSDLAALVRLDCGNGVGLNTSNLLAPSVNANSSNGVNVAGNQVNAPSAGAGTDCNSGAVAVSLFSCANGGYLGISGTGNSSGTVAASGTGCAWGWYVGITGTGCGVAAILALGGTGTANGNGNDPSAPYGIGVSGTNNSYGNLTAASATKNASGGALAASGMGCAGGNNPSTGVSISTYCAWGGLAGISAFGDSGGQVSLSDGGTTNGGPVSISAVGHANGGSVLNVSGGDKSVGVLGIGVPLACDYGYSIGIGYGCGSGGPSSKPSQGCADGVTNGGGTEGPRIIHSPATLDFERGGYYYQTCYSTAPYDGSLPQAAGGVLVLYEPYPGGAGLGCASDPTAMVQFFCNWVTPPLPSDPNNALVGYFVGTYATVLGNTVVLPPTDARAGTGCASGTLAIATSSCGNGGILGANALGNASAGGYSYVASVPGVAASGLGSASAAALAASGTGCTGGNDPTTGIAISGTNCAWGGLAGVSALNSSSGWLASVGGTGCSSGQYVTVNATGCTSGGLVGISGTGYASGSQVAISGTGCASGSVAAGTVCGTPTVGDPFGVVAVGPTYADNPNAMIAVANGGTTNGSVLAASTTNQASSPLVAASGTGGANSSLIAASGAGGASGTQLAISGIGCTGGNDPNTGISISGTNCAWGGLAGISGFGDAGGLFSASGTGCSTGWYVGISGAGCAYSTLLAVSATGPATAYGNSAQLAGIPNGFGISGTNTAYGWLLGMSGTGSASGVNAISGSGDSNANGNQIYPGVFGLSLSGIGDAYGGTLAISGLGMASSNSGGLASIAIAGGKAVGRDLAISGTSDAIGTVAISGTGSSRGTVAISPFDTAEGSLVGVGGRGDLSASSIAINGDTLAAQIRFRKDFGLVPDPSLIQALLANPPSNNSQADFGVVLTDAEYNELMRRNTVGDQVYTIRDNSLANYPDEYSGVYTDHLDGGKIKVGFTGNLSLHQAQIQSYFPFPNDVQVVLMRFTYNYLESLQNTIDNSVQLLSAVGIRLVATELDEELNKVNVGIAYSTAASKSYLQNMFGPAIEVQQWREELTEGRESAWTPIRGGVKITSTKRGDVSTWKECTLGFISGGWAITAGHCVSDLVPGNGGVTAEWPNDWWQPCPPNLLDSYGNDICPNPGRRTPVSSNTLTKVRWTGHTDAAAFQINGPSSNSIYRTEQFPNGPISGFKSWRKDHVGDFSCLSGVTSGHICGKLKTRNHSGWDANTGVYLHNLRRTNIPVKHDAYGDLVGGDSGGPIYFTTQARGITHGYGCNADESQCGLTYSQIEWALNDLGLSL